MRCAFAKTFCLLVVAGLLGGLPAGASAKDLGLCSQTNSLAVFKNTTSTTSSKQFAALPGAAVNRNSGNQGCTTIEFSAQIIASGGVRVRLLVDGGPAGNPATADLYSVAGQTDERTVRFTLPNLDSGMHSFTIEYMSIDGSAVSVGKHLTILSFDDSII